MAETLKNMYSRLHPSSHSPAAGSVVDGASDVFCRWPVGVCAKNEGIDLCRTELESIQCKSDAFQV